MVLAFWVRSLYEHQQPRIDFVGEVMQRLGDVAGKRVADIGCGNGAYVSTLIADGAVVVAVDLSVGILRSVTAKPSGTVAADAQALPLAPASVDAVCLQPSAALSTWARPRICGCCSCARPGWTPSCMNLA